MAVRKSRKHFCFVVYSCFTNGSFTAAKIDGKFTTCYVKRGTICQYKVYKRGTFSLKNGIHIWYWTLGRSLTIERQTNMELLHSMSLIIMKTKISRTRTFLTLFSLFFFLCYYDFQQEKMMGEREGNAQSSPWYM